MTDIDVGSVLAGRLRIDREIGRGGMGVVFEAKDIALGRRVAVKVMAAAVAESADVRRRFEREARAAARLASEHVVRVLEIAEADDGTPYIVMELLEGRPLDAILAEEGPLPVAAAVGWVRQALAALREAHAAGLVHRDLKPANLFLATRLAGPPIVKVLDFGVVKELGPGAASLTRTGDTMGTPIYMAPEQIRAGEPVDARADVWAIGVTLYELVTQAIPFDGTSVAALLSATLGAPHVPARTRRADVPASLDAVLERCLAKAPSERFADAAALDDALAAVARELAEVGSAPTAPTAKPLPVRTTPTTPAVAAPDSSAPTVDLDTTKRSVRPAPTPRPSRPPARANSGALFAGAFLAVVAAGALAAVGYVLARPPGARPPPAPPTSPAPTSPPTVAIGYDANVVPPSSEGDDAGVDDDDDAGAVHAAPRSSAFRAAVDGDPGTVLTLPDLMAGLHFVETRPWSKANGSAWMSCARGLRCLYVAELRFHKLSRQIDVGPESHPNPITNGYVRCPMSDAVNACIKRHAANQAPSAYCSGTVDCAPTVWIGIRPPGVRPSDGREPW